MLPLVAVAQESFDLLIKNGCIVDGTGTPWYEADVGMVGERITRVGNLSGAIAPKVIDATGLIVAPGFSVSITCSEQSLTLIRSIVPKLIDVPS